MDTGRRPAKMYINELKPVVIIPMFNVTAFNRVENGYKGMLVVRSEIKRVCRSPPSVSGVAYIGIIWQNN